MDIITYKNKVIELFKSGKATDEQWAEMADSVLYASENLDEKTTFMIDKEVVED